MKFSILKPTKFRVFNKKIYGFDIETYDKNKKFLMASIHDGNKYWLFFEKQDLINFIKTKRFKNSYIAATNLGFDFFGSFFNKEEIKEFDMLWRGSDMIYARSNIVNKEFKKHGKKGQDRVTFIDTLNYAKLSVNDIGKILKLPKLIKPKCLGRKWKNAAEKKEMIEYNIRDSELSQKFIEFLFNSFSKLGANPKMTIASTSMSLYRNAYLKKDYFRHDVDKLLFQFKGYYGGNVHAYSRGKIPDGDWKYYDVNSLYPSVMRNEYPDPNTVRVCHINTLENIFGYEGVSDVDVSCPYMEYPLLPLKTENKLLFPFGSFRGVYSHVELRKAIELGYIIKKVHKTIYFKETCEPFRDYVNTLYGKRQEYLSENNPMEIVTKLLMNSLYGKFGQKFEGRENIVPFNHTIEELSKLSFFERIGDYLRIKGDSEPSPYCIPIWALYTSAYARLKLHEYIRICKPIYVDTDSLVTRFNFPHSKELGKLKLEFNINKGIIVKPKFYMLNSKCKIKGLGIKIKTPEFVNFLKTPSMTYDKFMKFKESLRRGFIPNEIISMTKTMDLEDNKRSWKDPFDFKSFQVSKPVYIEDGVIIRDFKTISAIQEEQWLETRNEFNIDC